MKRIGISLRSSHATNYVEQRDALARDWYRLLAELDDQHTWVMLPNIGEDIAQYAKTWQLEGFILTGGDDIGAEPKRDMTEATLIKYALTHNLPLLGVCRGAQFIGQYFGAQPCVVESQTHVNNHHHLSTPDLPWAAATSIEVNSFHHQACQLPLPSALTSFVNIDQISEGFMHTHLPIVGVMWHPERCSKLSKFDNQLLQWLFK